MKSVKLVLLMILFSGFLWGSEADTKGKDLSAKSMPAIVSVDWLKKNIDNPKVVIIDLQPKEKYLKGHIKGAVSMPGQPPAQILFDPKLLMPKLSIMTDRLSSAGVDKDSLVVVYDSGVFAWAARLYWILEFLGHENVGILQVGYGGWEKGELPVSTAVFEPKRKEFVPRIDNAKIKTKLDTLLAIDKKTIIDGRKKSHWKGNESLAKRFGHIPSAINYACTQNYEVTASGNRMRDLKELKGLYKDIPKDKEIILYCDGGAEAALNYIVLQELGYKASIYDGSWLEWGNDSEVPVSNPSKKK
ncbi:MAG: rhodanese-like domain-containing protein [Campylobacterota bacterium]|nr:rhodanese-like domain-containing protein [Campylobacterota bacterium]